MARTPSLLWLLIAFVPAIVSPGRCSNNTDRGALDRRAGRAGAGAVAGHALGNTAAGAAIGAGVGARAAPPSATAWTRKRHATKLIAQQFGRPLNSAP